MAELSQFDSLRVYVKLLHQVEQKQDSVICLQEEQITLLQKQLNTIRRMFELQQGYVQELEADRKVQAEQITRLQKKKPRRKLWMAMGAAIPVLLKVLIR